MSRPLAIFTPTLGALSETFIRRHVNDLLPNKVVVIAGGTQREAHGAWEARCPVLFAAEAPPQGRLQKLTGSMIRCFVQRSADATGMRIIRFLEQHDVRVCLGEYLTESLQYLPYARGMGLRFFAHGFGYDVADWCLNDPKWRKAYLQYNESDGVLAMTEVNRSRLIELGLEASKIHVVPCGVDVPGCLPDRVERKTVRCIAMSRMTGKKGPILLLDAFRRATTEYPGLHLDYVGAGELLAAVRQFVRAFDLADRVTLHGSLPHAVANRMLAEADIFLQHSMTDPDTGDQEGLPVAILEAMAQALPVVSTLHAGIPEAVQDGQTGYLVHEGDSAGMAERILVLARDRKLRCRMGETGWQRAKERFSWDRERRDLLRIMGLTDNVA